jgi:DNA repair exonuclease SbcCD ATPase subunit
LREELSSLYKTQSQNAQKLLDLSEKLRETEDRSRDATEQMRSMRLETERLGRRFQDATGAIKEKEKAIQHLNDELATAHLEYTQLERKNDDLQKDNKNLLQRWLDRVQDEVTQVNDANAFIVSFAGLCLNFHSVLQESTTKLRAQSQAPPPSPKSISASQTLRTPRPSTAKSARSLTPTRSRPPSPTHSVRSTSSRVSKAMKSKLPPALPLPK